jgi:hypothetical protein
MSFKTRLINFLLALAAWLLFAFQWVNNYASAWYANIPEETQYLRGAHATTYVYYAWLGGITFLLFLVLSIIYLVRETISRPLLVGLIAVLVFTSYIVFHFSSALPQWRSGGLLNYLILVLLALAAFRFYLTLNAAKNR